MEEELRPKTINDLRGIMGARIKRRRDKKAYSETLKRNETRDRILNMNNYGRPVSDQTHERFHTKDLIQIRPKTNNQAQIFQSFGEGQNLVIHGTAGTGKTFLAFYIALSEVLDTRSEYEKIIVLRSVVPTRDMGFMPGKESEKMEYYERPYVAICAELFPARTAYEYLKREGIIEFTTTSYVRGMTFRNAIVILDEAENLNFHELDSVITRIGEGCRIMICGDTEQTDLLNKRGDTTGLPQFMRIIDRMDSFDIIEMEEDDIVRSGIVREYLIAKRNIDLAEKFGREEK